MRDSPTLALIVGAMLFREEAFLENNLEALQGFACLTDFPGLFTCFGSVHDNILLLNVSPVSSRVISHYNFDLGNHKLALTRQIQAPTRPKDLSASNRAKEQVTERWETQ